MHESLGLIFDGLGKEEWQWRNLGWSGSRHSGGWTVRNQPLSGEVFSSACLCTLSLIDWLLMKPRSVHCWGSVLVSLSAHVKSEWLCLLNEAQVCTLSGEVFSSLCLPTLSLSDSACWMKPRSVHCQGKCSRGSVLVCLSLFAHVKSEWLCLLNEAQVRTRSVLVYL